MLNAHSSYSLTTLKEHIQLVYHTLTKFLLRLILLDKRKNIFGKCSRVSITAKSKQIHSNSRTIQVNYHILLIINYLQRFQNLCQPSLK